MEADEVEVEDGVDVDEHVQTVFGKKIAVCLVAQNWKLKEVAIKQVFKRTSAILESTVPEKNESTSLYDLIRASALAAGLTIKEKVIKVF